MHSPKMFKYTALHNVFALGQISPPNNYSARSPPGGGVLTRTTDRNASAVIPSKHVVRSVGVYRSQ